MKVYAVWYGDYEDRYIGEVFATRELAVQHIEHDSERLRRRWEAAQRLAGKPRKDAFWIHRSAAGEKELVPKTHPAPPPWEVYLAAQGKGEIEEFDVLDALPG